MRSLVHLETEAAQLVETTRVVAVDLCQVLVQFADEILIFGLPRLQKGHLGLVLLDLDLKLSSALLLVSQELLKTFVLCSSLLVLSECFISLPLTFLHELPQLEVDTLTFGSLLSKIKNDPFVLLSHANQVSQSIVETELCLFKFAAQ